MSLPRALLIDALGTLVALEPPAPRLRAALQARLGVEIGAGAAQAAIGAEIAYYRAHLHEGHDEDSVAQLRRECAAAMREALLAPGAAAAESRSRLAAAGIDELTAALLDSLEFTVYDDVVPALAALRAAGVRIVVASNWDASLPATLERVGLRDLLDGVVSSAARGVAKPDPGLFACALGLAGVGAHEAVHVGDSVVEDVAGARAAGIAPLLLLREGDGTVAPSGVETIRSLGELPLRFGSDARAPSPHLGPASYT